jgi:hypothetical protein
MHCSEFKKINIQYHTNEMPAVRKVVFFGWFKILEIIFYFVYTHDQNCFLWPVYRKKKITECIRIKQV